MKVILRISLGFGIALFIFLALGCGLLFVPGIQLRLASLVLNKRFDYVSLEALKLSPSGFALRNLQLIKNQAHIRLPKLELYWDFFSLLHRKPFQLKSFEVLGLQIDAPRPEDLNALLGSEPSADSLAAAAAHRPASPTPSQSTPASLSFPQDLEQAAPVKVKKSLGLLRELAFLDRIAIDKLVVRGSLSFSDEELSFTLGAQNLAPKMPGRLRLEGHYKNTQQDRAFDGLSLEGDVRIHFENKNQAREIQGDILAKLEHPQQPLSTHFTFGIEPSLNGEYYTLESFILEEANQATALFSVEGNLDQTLQKIEAKFSCNIDEAQLRKCFPQALLPDILLKAQGTAEYKLKHKTLALAAFLDLDARKLEHLEASLPSLEAVYLRNKVDAKLSPDGIELKVLHSLLQDKAGKSLLKCELLQPFSARFSAQGLQFNAVQGPLLSLSLTDFPFAYLSPFIKNYTIQAKPIGASFVMELEGQTLSFVCKGPLTLNELWVSQGEEPLFEDLSFELEPHIRYNPEAITLEYTQCKLMQGKAQEDLLALEGKVRLNLADGQSPVSVETSGMVLANLQGLLQQKGIQKHYAPPLKGSLFFASSYNCSYHLLTKTFKLNQLEGALTANLKLPTSEAYLSFQNLQSTSFDCSAPVLAPFSANAQGPLFKLVLNQLPLSLLEPLDLPVSIGGDSVSGSLLLTREDLAFPNKEISQGYNFVLDHLSIKRLSLGQGKNPSSQEQDILKQDKKAFSQDHHPLKQKQYALKQDKNAFSQDKRTPTPICIANLNGSLAAEGFFSPQYLKAQWTQASLSLFGNQKPLLESNGQIAIALRPEAGLDGLETVDAKLLIDLQQLFSLEAMPFLNNLEKGKLQLNFYGNFVGQRNFKSLLYLKNLIFVDSGKSIDSLHLSLAGKIEDWKTFHIKGPLILQGPSGKTDLDLEAQYRPEAKEGSHYDLKLEGERAFVDDLLLLSQVVLPEEAPKDERAGPMPSSSPASPPLEGARGDTLAFWKGLEGASSVYIGALHYKDIIITQLHLESSLSPNLALAKLDGKYVGAPFSSTLDLAFNAKLPTPYTLKTKLELAEFDLGTLVVGAKLLASTPLEGTFKVQAKASSEGLNQVSLLENLQGTLYLDGKNGSVKTFAATSKATQAGTKALAIAGTFLGSQVKELDFISQVIQFFSNIPYDHCALVIERGLDKTIDIQTLSLKGPEIYLSGRGRIDHHPSIPLGEQNMRIHTRLDAKGKGASLLNSLGLLREKTSSEGYFSGPEFTIGGTPSKPDFSELYKLLISSGQQTPSPSSTEDTLPSPTASSPKDPLQSLLNLFN